MGIFSKKPRVVKEIHDGLWGYMVNMHGIDVDTLARDIRCVEHRGNFEGKGQVTLVRVFKPKDTAAQGVEVTGWETFDEHPELILFEGYLDDRNEAHLERKSP